MERLAGRIILLWGWRRALTAFLAGALAVLMQAPYDFFAAGLVSFPVLVWLLDGAATATPGGLLRRLLPAFAVGWWFGFGYFLAGLWWVGSAMLVDADQFAWALPFAVIGLPFLLAFFYGFATALARLFWSSNIGRIAALSLGFGVAEWLRTVLFTGFPWLAIGYAAMPLPLLMQSAKIVALIGMNALTVFVLAMPALLAARRDRLAGALLVVLLVGAHVGFGFWDLTRPQAPNPRTLAVRIVQPAVDMAIKWDRNSEDAVFKSLLALSAQPPAEGKPRPALILWPETAVPFLFTQRPDALSALGGMLQPGQRLIAGAMRTEGGAGNTKDALYYNSVIAIDPGGQIADAVDKVHLVPFGEYMPFAWLLDRIGVSQIVAGPMNFAAGSGRHAIELPGGFKAVPFICYEIIFPELVAHDTREADLIVSVTNDAWFGNTPGPYQHFRIAQVRAAETGLPVVRAANTGISGVIDARGRVVDALAIGAKGVIDATVAMPPREALLPFAPRLVGLAVLAFMALFALAMRARQRLAPN